MSMYDLLSADDVTTADIPPNAGDLICEECGNNFDHTGRGRKPKKCPTCREAKSTTTGTARASSRRTTSKDVESAIAVLDGAYNTLALGLLMLSPNAASVWAERIDDLQKTNRVTLAGDPALCKSILRVGEKSGKAAFVIAHVVAVAPVVVALQQDFVATRKPRVKESAQPPIAEWEQEISYGANTNTNVGFFE